MGGGKLRRLRGSFPPPPSRQNPDPGVYDDGIREDISKQIAKLYDELKVRQESIDLLEGRRKNQITSFKEMAVKVLEKDTLLAEKIRMLFREDKRTKRVLKNG